MIADADRTAGLGRKLYCYVDESGQDKRGELFVVVAVILAEERAAKARSNGPRPAGMAGGASSS